MRFESFGAFGTFGTFGSFGSFGTFRAFESFGTFRAFGAFESFATNEAEGVRLVPVRVARRARLAQWRGALRHAWEAQSTRRAVDQRSERASLPRRRRCPGGR